MTIREKDAVRKQMCVLCLAMPPFADGSRSQVHRIIRGKDGGQYTDDNVISLCPSCHSAVDRLVMITAARKGGLRLHELYPNLARETALRTRQRYPEWAREMGSRTGSKNLKAVHARRTPAERSEHSRKAFAGVSAKGRLATIERKRRGQLTEKELAHLANVRGKNGHNIGRARMAALTPEQISAIGRKGGLASGRWNNHKKRSR